MRPPLKDSRNTRTFPGLLATALVVAIVSSSGFAAGTLANRWSEPAELIEAVKSLKTLPETCGEWRLLAETEIDPEVIEMLACTGYVNRSYRRQGGNDTVHVAIVVGPPGRIAVHTPEICYASQGFHLEQPPLRRSFELPDGKRGEFVYTSFLPDALGRDDEPNLIAYHAFSDGGAWQAPEHPRFAFGGRPYLMKLQLAGRTKADSAQAMRDPCRDFLEAFLPVLERSGIGGLPR